MARVVGLDRERTRRLSYQIERELRLAAGRTVSVGVEYVEDVGRWRRAAVMAAHRMGHHASTYVWGTEVVVELDLPVTEAELRQAALVTSSLITPRRRRG